MIFLGQIVIYSFVKGTIRVKGRKFNLNAKAKTKRNIGIIVAKKKHHTVV